MAGRWLARNGSKVTFYSYRQLHFWNARELRGKDELVFGLKAPAELVWYNVVDTRDVLNYLRRVLGRGDVQGHLTSNNGSTGSAGLQFETED